jgi:hypothetical protein
MDRRLIDRVAAGLVIIAMGKNSYVSAEHDVIYAGATGLHEESEAALLALGWVSNDEEGTWLMHV